MRARVIVFHEEGGFARSRLHDTRLCGGGFADRGCLSRLEGNLTLFPCRHVAGWQPVSLLPSSKSCLNLSEVDRKGIHSGSHGSIRWCAPSKGANNFTPLQATWLGDGGGRRRERFFCTDSRLRRVLRGSLESIHILARGVVSVATSYELAGKEGFQIAYQIVKLETQPGKNDRVHTCLLRQPV